jgi:hypothetical protein
MASYHLKLNADKTDVVWLGSQGLLKKLPYIITALAVDGNC